MRDDDLTVVVPVEHPADALALNPRAAAPLLRVLEAIAAEAGVPVPWRCRAASGNAPVVDAPAGPEPAVPETAPPRAAAALLDTVIVHSTRFGVRS